MMRLLTALAVLGLATPAAAGGYYERGAGYYAESEHYEAWGRYEAEGRRAPPRCDPRVGPDHPYACPPGWGEVRLNDSFFWDAGGVGPAWIAGGGGGGGGGVVLAGAGAGSGASAGAGGGARAAASASASAAASVTVSVRFRGGFRGGHGSGRKGGHGCGC